MQIKLFIFIIFFYLKRSLSYVKKNIIYKTKDYGTTYYVLISKCSVGEKSWPKINHDEGEH